jgi:hypothetical protein
MRTTSGFLIYLRLGPYSAMHYFGPLKTIALCFMTQNLHILFVDLHITYK